MFFLIKVPLAIPEALEVTASSPSSLRVRWQPAAGATQYMALYSALNDGEPDDAKEVSLGHLTMWLSVSYYVRMV